LRRKAPQKTRLCGAALSLRPRRCAPRLLRTPPILCATQGLAAAEKQAAGIAAGNPRTENPAARFCPAKSRALSPPPQVALMPFSRFPAPGSARSPEKFEQPVQLFAGMGLNFL
jgi:hypothetical protein